MAKRRVSGVLGILNMELWKTRTVCLCVSHSVCSQVPHPSYVERASGDQLEAAALAEPVGLKIRVGGLGGSGAGDGDEVALRIAEGRGVCLEAGAETAADEVAVVGFFRGALAGDECGSDGRQGGIR